MSKTRQIEMYAGDNSSYWWTDLIEIPADTPEEEVERVALEVYYQELSKKGAEIAIMGVYCVPEFEEELCEHET